VKGNAGRCRIPRRTKYRCSKMSKKKSINGARTKKALSRRREIFTANGGGGSHDADGGRGEIGVPDRGSA